jgi:hypothetical protein
MNLFFSFYENLSLPAFLFFILFILGHLLTFSFPSKCSLIQCIITSVLSIFFDFLVILFFTWLIDRMYHYGNIGYFLAWGSTFIMFFMILNTLYLVTTRKRKQKNKKNIQSVEDESSLPENKYE